MRRGFDSAFPTIIRYTGWATMLVAIVLTVLRGLEFPGLYVAATGMILYKTVRNSGNGNGAE